MNKIKCILFDVGGVLAKENIDPVYKNLNEKLGKRVFGRKTTLHKKSLCGKIKEKEFYGGLSKKSGISARKLRTLMTLEYTKILSVNKDVARIAKRLRKHGDMTAILSNVTSEHKRINSRHGIYKGFSPMILSCDAGCMKPQKKIFELALKKSNAKPNECVFIDDRKEFLQTPQKIGMKTIHFKDAKNLISELRKIGIDS